MGAGRSQGEPGGARRAVVAVAATVAAVVALPGCARPRPSGAGNVPVVVPSSPEQVTAVTIRAHGATVRLTRDARGAWSVSKGEPEALALWIGELDTLLPLHAYRSFTVRRLDPAYGLDRPALAFAVRDSGGGVRAVSVGRQTLDGEGFYAKVAGAPAVFIITRDAASAIVSVATGQPFTFPLGKDEQRRVDLADHLSTGQATPNDGQPGATGSDQQTVDPWLQQALDSGAAVPGGG